MSAHMKKKKMGMSSKPILPVVFFFKARPTKNMTKERNPVEVLTFWSEHNSVYAPLEQVTALN